MITLDGSYGEGGGQILRTALALSMVTKKEFTISNIRAGRKKPGLLRQHLTAVNAAAEVCDADVTGNILGSASLTFKPGAIKAGQYHFSIGSAGSAMLVFQTVLPALLCAHGTSELLLEGGTHNPFAPPFDFLNKVFLRELRNMGIAIESEIHQYGFFPAGGGSVRFSVTPADQMKRTEIMKRGDIRAIRTTALFSRIPADIAKKEIQIVQRELALPDENCSIHEVQSPGPGNVLLIEIESEHAVHMITSFGERNRTREQVAMNAVAEAQAYIGADVPVGEYLADQLLVPMSIAGGGRFITCTPSLHTETNCTVIEKFIDIAITRKEVTSGVWEISIGETK